jgi:membrane fusion protein, heavy metal efflux system
MRRGHEMLWLPRPLTYLWRKIDQMSSKLRSLGYLAALLTVLFAGPLPATEEVAPQRARNLVILDAASVENLGIETRTADDQTFEQILFAAGRVEAVPASRAVVSQTNGGRVLEVKVAPGDAVEAGAEILRVEPAGGGAPVTLMAPIGGLVTALHVTQGEAYRRFANLAEITDLRQVDVIARLPEHEASLLAPWTNARIFVPASCDKIFRGQLVRFGTEGDRKHGTVEGYFRLANKDLLMRPGMRAEFRITASQKKTSALPREAVQGQGAERFVFVKDFELPHAFVRVPVVTGLRNDQMVEIVSGLMPGDEVVTKGAYALSSAGRGTVSLKAALDAAHGHPHAEDGTPLSGAEGEKHGRESSAAHGGAAGRWSALTLFFACLSVLLLALLVLSRRQRAVAAA